MEYDPKLQMRLEEFIKQAGSQAKAAQQICLSTATLSGYRKSAYAGNVEQVESNLTEFFKLKDEQQKVSEKAEPYRPMHESYVPTSISEDIYKAIRYCQIEKGIAVLHGDAGIGKTKAAEKFVTENPGTAIYLMVSPIAGTLGSFLKLLARVLKVPETSSKLEMILSIREKLDGTDKVLIIDEAQHLKLSALEEIRSLSDPNMMTGRSGIGIVLIGNTEVYNRMRGRQEARFAQLFSRIRMNRCYSTRQVRKEDVLKLFPALAGKDKEINFLHGICQSKWGVRGAVNVYNNAVNNENVSLDGLTLIARKMGIGIV